MSFTYSMTCAAARDTNCTRIFTLRATLALQLVKSPKDFHPAITEIVIPDVQR